MKLLTKPDFQVHCFQEDRGVTWLKRTQIVDYESSRTGSPHELVETLTGDHIAIISYTSPTDPNYVKVSRTLEMYIGEIPVPDSARIKGPYVFVYRSEETHLF